MPALIAGATVAGSAISGGSSLLGGKQAQKAAKSAADLQLQQQQRTQALLQPWTTAGAGVLPNLTSLATAGPTGGGPNYVTQAEGLAPGAMTEANLVQTPGYQFTLGQGLKATQSAAAARGLGVSGAALKGAATFATGLADKTYQDQFNLQQQRFTNALSLNTAQQGNLQNQFQRLFYPAQLGESAAAGTGQLGQQAAGLAGQYGAQAGQIGGAATAGVGSAANQGVQNLLGYNILQQAISQNQSGNASPWSAAAGGWASPPGVAGTGQTTG